VTRSAAAKPRKKRVCFSCRSRRRQDCQTHGNVPYVVRPERPIIDNGLLLIVPAPLHGRAGPLVEKAHLA